MDFWMWFWIVEIGIFTLVWMYEDIQNIIKAYKNDESMTF